MDFYLKKTEMEKTLMYLMSMVINCHDVYRLAHISIIAHNRFETFMAQAVELRDEIEHGGQ